MHRTLLVRQLLPALIGYVVLVPLAIACDAVLHRLGLRDVGLWFGPAGTLLIVLSFLYSLRKRRLIRVGQPARLLALHETLGWIGTLLILVHGGAHFSALVPWLALVALLVVVASGFTGSVLLKRASAALRAKAATGDDSHALLDAVTLDIMKRWRAVHLPLNAVFAVLTLLHVGAVLTFGDW
jgi:cytochrome b561